LRRTGEGLEVREGRERGRGRGKRGGERDGGGPFLPPPL